MQISTVAFDAHDLVQIITGARAKMKNPSRLTYNYLTLRMQATTYRPLIIYKTTKEEGILGKVEVQISR